MNNTDRRNVSLGDSHSYLANRKRVVNNINNSQHIGAQTLNEYKRQQEEFNKEKARLEAPPSFKKTRTLIIFRGQYMVITLSFALLLLNSVLRGFSGVWWYLVPNFLFILFYLMFSSYFNPLDYASDTKNYIRPKLDRVYLQLQDILKVLLTLLGTNLEKKPQGSLKTAQIIAFVGTLIGILFYNSGFVILSLPFIFLFVVRSFVAGKTIEAGDRLRLFKWILFILLACNSILSAYWKTPFGFELLIVISIVNSLQLWLQNTEVYGVEVIARLRQEEERRLAEDAHRRAAQLEEQRRLPQNN